MTFTHLFVLFVELVAAVAVGTLGFVIVLGLLRGVADVWRER